MKRKIITLAFLTASITLVSCGQNSQSAESSGIDYPDNDLTRMFVQLKNNDFTYDFTRHREIDGSSEHSKFYYTPYSFQSEGVAGEQGVAQGDGYIFKYSFDNDVIIPSTPTLNSSTGIRYASIYDFTKSLEDIDLRDLPTEKDDEGFYHYEFGVNLNNDYAFLPVFTRQDSRSLPSRSLKMRVVGETLEVSGVINSNTDGTMALTFQGYVTDIGSTTNSLIKSYLDSGKTALEPLDRRFISFFNPYFYSHNYTMDIDKTGMTVGGVKQTLKFTEYSTENGYLDVKQDDPSYVPRGEFEYLGAVHQFNVTEGKLKVTSTPTDQDGNSYSTLYGERIPESLTSLSLSNLSGYKDPDNPETYVINDSQFVYYFGNLAYLPQGDEQYYDAVSIKIIDEAKHEFEASIKVYNRVTKEDYGIFKARFSNLNNTRISYIDDYTYLGDEPTEDKTLLQAALSEFHKDNYSMDILSGAGLSKVYYTPNYMYQESYGNPDQNFGYYKHGNQIFAFSLIRDSVGNRIVNKTGDDLSLKGMVLPGVGDVFQADNDASFFSRFHENELYNIDNYSLFSLGDISFYKNDAEVASNGTSMSFGQAALNYALRNPSSNVLLPGGSGFKVSHKNNDYRLSFIVSYLSTDGTQSSYYPFTFYDIGKTSYQVIDDYIKAL